MSCPSCGAETSSGSNFCKLCGSSLSTQPASEPRLNPARLAGMFWAVTALVLGSFGILFGTALPMVLAGIDGGVIIPIVGLGAGATMIIAALLIRQLSRLITMMQNYPPSPLQRSIARASVPQPPQLAAPFSGSPSITEHTTRNFDPASLKAPDIR
jgi:hypothetical protein